MDIIDGETKKNWFPVDFPWNRSRAELHPTAWRKCGINCTLRAFFLYSSIGMTQQIQLYTWQGRSVPLKRQHVAVTTTLIGSPIK